MIALNPPSLQPDLSYSEQELEWLELYKNAHKNDIFQLQKKLSSKLIHQIYARQSINEKLPFLAKETSIVYPEKLSLEQCSSEATARYKASLFSGKRFVDLTSGFGIDSYFFAQHFESGVLVERNETLSAIVSHNYTLLHQSNIQFASGVETEDFLRECQDEFDLIYVDPARRNEHGGKVVLLEGSEPDVVTLLPRMLSLAPNILIKTSPLLDIHAACQSLKYVRHVHVVALNNECKELLFHLEQGYNGEYTIHAVHLQEGQPTIFESNPSTESSLEIEIGSIEKYLYEPNAAIMKAGLFKSIASKFRLKKLHVNTHLYTSSDLIQDFPGRRFIVDAVCQADKRQVRLHLPNQQANVSIRNFPGSSNELKRKLELKDGGDFYIFGITDSMNEKRIIITRKVHT